MEARAIWAVLMSLFCHNGVNFRKGSLRASSPFGGYREQYTRERHARRDATAGGGGGGAAPRGFAARSPK